MTRLRLQAVSFIAGVVVYTLSPVFAQEPTRPEVRDTVLVIDDDITSVRQIQRLLIRQGTHPLPLAPIPDTFAPETLTLASPQNPLEVMTWQRRSASLEPQDGRQWFFSSIDEYSEWMPTVRSRVRGIYPVHVSYLCRGITWSAEYQVTYRVSDKTPQQATCTLACTVQLDNQSGLDFRAAQVRLVQTDDSGDLDVGPANDPGFLMLNEDSPVSRTWTEIHPSSSLRKTFLLSGRVTIPNRRPVRVTLADRDRVKALRQFRNEPPATQLVEWLLIANQRENGLGVSLPAGHLRVEGRGASASAERTVRVGASSPDDILELPLGPAEGIEVQREPQRILRKQLLGQDVEYRITFKNARPYEVQIEWREIPDTSYSWQVLRSSHRYEVQNRSVRFSFTIPPESDTALEYRVRYRRPTP